jgi:hypothetical protein
MGRTAVELAGWPGIMIVVIFDFVVILYAIHAQKFHDHATVCDDPPQEIMSGTTLAALLYTITGGGARYSGHRDFPHPVDSP